MIYTCVTFVRLVPCLNWFLVTIGALSHWFPVSLQEDVSEDDIDWWSKYYASTGDLSKCRSYLEKGYDKIQVCKLLFY